MKALLAMMDLERRWAISDRDPIRHWHKGRVALIGDAAHPTLQSLAQGACMAIEDGRLPRRADRRIATATSRRRSGSYEARPLAAHRPRAARVARDLGVLHAGGIARDVRNATVPEWTEAHMFDCLAWLYDGFALPTERR